MYSIRIVGAGSIGNHLAHAARTRGWQVTLTDIDPVALARARDEIYPGRYGKWDPEIVLKRSVDSMRDEADVVFIGTPPDTHMGLALEALANARPKILLIEKPLAGPDLAGCDELLRAAGKAGVFCAVGYNHCLGKNTVLTDRILGKGKLGQPQTISTRTREHWAGIFNAHPWLSGPPDSYLGFSARGGGASGEHSHAINLWQHFAHVVGAGRVVEISATLDMVADGGMAYDRAAFITLTTESGLTGDVIQDVVTLPAEKSARIQCDKGFVEWSSNATAGADMVRFASSGEAAEEVMIKKTRADDFIWEVDHLAEIMGGRVGNSPISIERGLDTMLVIAAAHQSHRLGRRVRIDWARGYVPDAIV